MPDPWCRITFPSAPTLGKTLREFGVPCIFRAQSKALLMNIFCMEPPG